VTQHESFDDARLRELEADFGADDLAFVIEAFLEEAADAVAGLAPTVSDGPDPARAAQLHFLVGSAGNVGATGLADLCRAHELTDGGFGADDYRAIVAAFEDARGWLSERTGRTPAYGVRGAPRAAGAGS